MQRWKMVYILLFPEVSMHEDIREVLLSESDIQKK